MDFKEADCEVWTGVSWLTTGTSGGLYEHDQETCGSIKDGEFLDHLSDYQLLNESPTRSYFAILQRRILFVKPENGCGQNGIFFTTILGPPKLSPYSYYATGWMTGV
jgi:hypothetical protein